MNKDSNPLLPLDNMHTPRKRKSELLNRAISQIDPAEQARAEQRMALSVRISEALDKKGLSKSQFALQMGKEPSEVTKWLSGTHNFTANTLTDIGRALDINFFYEEEEKPKVVQDQYTALIMFTNFSFKSNTYKKDKYPISQERVVHDQYYNN